MLVNVFYIWNMYIRVPLICFKSYHLPNFDQLTRLSTFTCMFFVWFINMVRILRTWSVEKSQLEIYRFNVSTVFTGEFKMHFGELKKRFIPTAPIHILWYIRNVKGSLEVTKSVFHLKYDVHSCSFYLFQKLSPPNFRSTYSILEGYV
jgi:hypothetical protein